MGKDMIHRGPQMPLRGVYGDSKPLCLELGTRGRLR